MLPCFQSWITKAKNIHWGLTAGALKNRSGSLFDKGKKNPQNQLHNKQQFLCVAMKKPIVSDPPKPLGWQSSFLLLVCRTMVMPISAPRFLGFKPKSLSVLEAQTGAMSMITPSPDRHEGC
jgi:hypothetical protein